MGRLSNAVFRVMRWEFLLRFYMITLKEKVKTGFSSRDASEIFNLSLKIRFIGSEPFQRTEISKTLRFTGSFLKEVFQV